MAEKVFVVPRKDLFPEGEFHGISTKKISDLLSVIEGKGYFMDRAGAEKNRDFKQIIPYVVLTRGGQIFTVTRSSTQAEARLHQKVSIGLGGHINPQDARGKVKPWESGLRRELAEEVSVKGEWEPSLAGFLNDDSTPVGSVHFGLVYRVDLTAGEILIREKDKMIGTFFPPEEVASFYNQMESWSQIVFSAFWPDFLEKVNAVSPPFKEHR